MPQQYCSTQVLICKSYHKKLSLCCKSWNYWYQIQYINIASDTDLGPIGKCYLISMLELRTDQFIALQDLWRNLILELKWQYNYKIGCNLNINEWTLNHNTQHLLIHQYTFNNYKTYSLECRSKLLTTQRHIHDHSPSNNIIKTTVHLGA